MQSKEEIKKRINFLTKELNKHNYQYYVLAQPIISDYEFDQLLKELENLEQKMPKFRNPDSPTIRVGGEALKGFEKFTHKSRMLSLQNTYSQEELVDFDTSIKKLLGGKDFSYIVQPKYDGVSLSLHYENGLLKTGVSRGDGTVGDIITENVKTIHAIPLKIEENENEFEVRGEVMMHKDDFTKLNEARIENGEAPLMNPRNTTAGSLRLLDSKEVAKRPLDFFAYYLNSQYHQFERDSDAMNQLGNWRFKLSPDQKVCQNIDEVFDYITKWQEKKENLSYEVDGVVVKVNELSLREEIGTTSKFPRWAIAYKFPATKVQTIVNSVSFHVGRTGVVTPVANLKPVLIDGTTVKRASIYNADEIERLDLHIGDFVTVEKGGEIIPKITAVAVEKRSIESEKVVYPKICPDCETELLRKEGEANYYCPNHFGCPTQVKGRISHFSSRKAMNIDGLGEEIVRQLYENQIIVNYADLYDLKFETLIELERFAEKSAKNLITAIEKSKARPFKNVLYALGIRYVGETVAKKLAEHFKNLDNLMNATQEEIENVYEIGERIAESIVIFFQNDQNQAIIQRLKNHHLQFELKKEQIANTSDKLQSKSFVVSGVFEHFSRDELKNSIKSNGGILKTSISSKVDYLIAGDKMGPAKKEKAEKLGLNIISEQEFIEMIS